MQQLSMYLVIIKDPLPMPPPPKKNKKSALSMLPDLSPICLGQIRK